MSALESGTTATWSDHAPAIRPASTTGTRRHRGLHVAMPMVLAGLLGLQVALVVHGLDGRFVYTLDDPYIHLALADNIARGHYGLDPLQPAAPSSSILYPFLLAGLSWAGMGDLAPLVVNVLAALASGTLLAVLIGDVFPAAAWRPATAIGLAVAMSLGLNLVGLAMTGMEHGLHVAVTIAWVLGAWRFLRDGRVAPWWWISALAEPLIRYEGVLLWLATVLLLLFRRSRLAGLTLALAGALPLGGFSAFLLALGLPALPSSVLVKTSLTSAGLPLPHAGPLGHIFDMITMNLSAPGAGVLATTTVALGLLMVRQRQSRDPDVQKLLPLTLVAGAAGLAQFAFGRIDGFSRYEIYGLALQVCVLAIGYAETLRNFNRRSGWLGWVVVLAALALPLSVYVERSLSASAAARNIYEQQHQMHRFAAEFYRAPVAVNDLGQVTYRNPYPVLDLWGLGSEEARRARAQDETGRWMETLVSAHGVGLAMIYDKWFPARPPEWVPVARLRLGTPLVSAAEGTVTFYATAPDRVAPIEAALKSFEPTLPSGVRLERASR